MHRPVTTWKVLAGAALVAAGATAIACGSDDAGGAASGGSGGAGGASGSGGASGAGGIGGAAGSGGSGGVVASECPPGLASDADVGQSLPQASVDTAWVAPTGASTKVPSTGDLQAALDAAQPGDEIRLESGATFTGPFTLPKKSGDGAIIIRTDLADSELPAPGQRIDPSYSGKLAKIVVSGNVGAAIQAAAGAHHYRLVGLEVSPAPGEYVTNLVNLGTGATSTADLAHHIVIDRCYLHGDATAGARRGVALNSADTAVVGSWLSDFKEKAADSQAIAGWTGPGPFKIVNNHLEGAAENVMFGGADPAIQDLVPSDITICRNHIVKPAAWQALDWSEKNLFELKNARRVLVAGNVLENNWADAQVGFAVVLTPRNQDGSAAWSTVEDLTFVHNVIRHTASGITIAGEDDNHPSQQQQRVLIQNNLLDDVDKDTYGGDGRVFQIVAPQKPSKQVKIDHNTATKAGNAFLVLGDSVVVSDGVTITNNIVPKGDYGAFGTGKGEGTGAFDFFLQSYVFEKNAIVGGTESSYPSGNFFPASMNDVGFEDFAGGNFALSSASAYVGKGNDGKDLGADISALLAATAGVAP